MNKLEILQRIDSRYKQMQEVKIRCMDDILPILKDKDIYNDERCEAIIRQINMWSIFLDEIKNNIDEDIQVLKRRNSDFFKG